MKFSWTLKPSKRQNHSINFVKPASSALHDERLGVLHHMDYM
jgi:hypothetical protein